MFLQNLHISGYIRKISKIIASSRESHLIVFSFFLFFYFRFIRGDFGLAEPRRQLVADQSIQDSTTIRAGETVRVSRGILPIEAILLLLERRHGAVEGRVLSLQGQKRHPGYIGQKWKGQDTEEVLDGGTVQ